MKHPVKAKLALSVRMLYTIKRATVAVVGDDASKNIPRLWRSWLLKMCHLYVCGLGTQKY